MTTSDPAECFVHVQLPGAHDWVTCGRYTLRNGVGRFVYGRSYLANPRAVELDKFELPLRPGTFETARLGGIFGALRDAAPDAWGRRIIERRLARSDLSELEFLLHSPADRAGALAFGRDPTPPTTLPSPHPILQLGVLLEDAERIEQGLAPRTGEVSSLMEPGSSLGGARPKNVVEDADGLWIAKFPSRGDRWNNAAVEGAMLQLARECGLDAAHARTARVARHQVLLVRRFDRERTADGYLRHRMVSALTVLRGDETPQERTRWSYPQFADELKRWTQQPERDLRELFGRLVFNALISNVDDHPRNHALIAPPEGWRLAPAYDLTPSPTTSTERDLAMEVGRFHRRATRQNLLSECRRFRLAQDSAEAIIDRMKATVSARWRDAIREQGGSAQDVTAVERAFGNEGFEYTSGSGT